MSIVIRLSMEKPSFALDPCAWERGILVEMEVEATCRPVTESYTIEEAFSNTSAGMATSAFRDHRIMLSALPGHS